MFYDINKLPPKKGILIFGISMSRIHNTQSPEKCWEYIKHFGHSKVQVHGVGANFIYGDFLYLHSNEPANKFKKQFMSDTILHKQNIMKHILSDKSFVPSAFSFLTWNQLYLDCDSSIHFPTMLSKLRKQFDEDETFQKYMKEDLKYCNKQNLDENQIMFFLEEHFMMYLMMKGKVRLRNDYVEDKESRNLFCYPGKPLKHHMYIYQKNFFKFSNPDNYYENSFFDLEGKKLYIADKIILDTYNYE